MKLIDLATRYLIYYGSSSKIRATDPKISIFTMLDPNISPKANDGLGGSSKTADMLAESSGREVAKATRILPTKSLPSPAIDASMSPCFAKYEPNNTVATTLNAKIIMLKFRNIHNYLPLTCFLLANSQL